MPSAPASRNRFTLFALWLVFYASFTLFLPPLLDDADSVHAEVAREMLLRHDWVTLYANGIRYLEKAPVLYWSMALSFKLFGVSTAAARLPIALTVLALALLLEAFARQAFRSARAGLYAGLILLSSFGIFIFTRITIPDADVCLWLALALLAFWTTEQPSPEAPVDRRPCYTFAAACALNVLTKGLIGLVFPVATVLAYLLLTRGPRAGWKRLRQLHPIASTLVFFAIAAPWHILIGLANPTAGRPAPITFAGHHWQVPLPTDGNVHGWFWFYFVNEHLLRYLNLRVPRDYDTVPLWLFLGLIIVWLMPWSAFLYPALKAPLRCLRRIARPHPDALSPTEKTLVLLALWAAIPLLFFAFSTRQEYYVLPALPAFILLLANFLSLSAARPNDGPAEPPLPAAFVFLTGRDHKGKLIQRDPALSLPTGPGAVFHAQRAAYQIAIVLLALGTLAAAAILFFLLRTRTPARTADLATLLGQNPADYALSFGHFLDLNAPALGLFRLPLALAALAAFAGPLANLLLRRHRRAHAANLSLAAATFVFLLAAHLGLQTFAPVLSSKALADAIAPHLHPEDLIVLHGEYESGSTLGFYLRRPGPGGEALHILEGRSSNLWYGSFFPDAPPIFETRQTLASRWPGPQRIFLWEDPADHQRPPLQFSTPAYVVAQSGGKQILSNRPDTQP